MSFTLSALSFCVKLTSDLHHARHNISLYSASAVWLCSDPVLAKHIIPHMIWLCKRLLFLFEAEVCLTAAYVLVCYLLRLVYALFRMVYLVPKIEVVERQWKAYEACWAERELSRDSGEQVLSSNIWPVLKTTSIVAMQASDVKRPEDVHSVDSETLRDEGRPGRQHRPRQTRYSSQHLLKSGGRRRVKSEQCQRDQDGRHHFAHPDQSEHQPPHGELSSDELRIYDFYAFHLISLNAPTRRRLLRREVHRWHPDRFYAHFGGADLDARAEEQAKARMIVIFRVVRDLQNRASELEWWGGVLPQLWRPEGMVGAVFAGGLSAREAC